MVKDILLKGVENKKVAIIEGEKSITYTELYNNSNNNSNLIKEYCKKNNFGKNIGIFLNNSIDYALAYFSINLCDKIIVPINVKAKTKELISTISYCELDLIITNSFYKKVLKELIEDENITIDIFNLDENDFERIGSKSSISNNKDNSGECEDVVIMLHTSGTTSNPKRVMLTNKSLIANIKSNIESLKLTENDISLIALPMTFGYCNTAQFLTHLYLGATIVIMNGLFIPTKFFSIVDKYKITNFTGVPTMLLLLLDFNNKKYNINSLRFICFGGGKMPLEKLKLLIEKYPSIGFLQTYGQTEASPRVTLLRKEDSLRKIGSVGKPIPNVKVRIVDEFNKDVSSNNEGEIIVFGDNLMKGYYKNPIETSKVLKDGWLYTGDLGVYDEEGYIYIVGRKKNVIISGGINVYPEEIEEVLTEHYAIQEAYVFGEDDNILGEVPVAKVVLKENNEETTEGEIKNYCLDKLASYKVPKNIEFVNSLEKTTTGKIRRKKERRSKC